MWCPPHSFGLLVALSSISLLGYMYTGVRMGQYILGPRAECTYVYTTARGQGEEEEDEEERKEMCMSGRDDENEKSDEPCVLARGSQGTSVAAAAKSSRTAHTSRAATPAPQTLLLYVLSSLSLSLG